MPPDQTLTAFIDFKSPYAYLAIEPTRQLAHDLGIAINWLPFVLDIPSYLGSARLDSSGKVAKQARSKTQWSTVKYAYYDCRRYANLRGMTVRGTEKIWDTRLAAIGMLWAKQHGDDVLQRYIDAVYVPFWKRELDVEDLAVMERVLASAGATTDEFGDFVREQGAQENERIQVEAFDRGIFGVPTYTLGDEIFFGREHLPRIRWQLRGGVGDAPDVAYELPPDSHVVKSSDRLLQVGIGMEDPESLLAINRIMALQDDLDLQVDWYALPSRSPQKKATAGGQERGARHREYRQQNRQRDQRRYLPHGCDSGDTVQCITDTLDRHNVQLRDSDVAASWVGVSSTGGYVGSPVFRLGEETFVGRQHLPLIRARLAD